MGFADGFYTFSIALADSDTSRYEQLRLKVTKHPYESLEYLVGRVIAFSHCFKAGVEFSTGLYNPKEPTIWAKNELGEVVLWADVGEGDIDRLLKARRRSPQALIRHYLLTDEEQAHWLHQRTKYPIAAVTTLECWRIDHSLIAALVPQLKLRNSWAVNLVDGRAFVSVTGNAETVTSDPIDVQGDIAPIGT